MEIYGQHYGCKVADGHDSIYDAVWLVYQSISLPPIFQWSRIPESGTKATGNWNPNPNPNLEEPGSRHSTDSAVIKTANFIMRLTFTIYRFVAVPFQSYPPRPAADIVDPKKNRRIKRKKRKKCLHFDSFHLSCSWVCYVHPWFVLYTLFEINLNCVTDF